MKSPTGDHFAGPWIPSTCNYSAVIKSTHPGKRILGRKVSSLVPNSRSLPSAKRNPPPHVPTLRLFGLQAVETEMPPPQHSAQCWPGSEVKRPGLLDEPGCAVTQWEGCWLRGAGNTGLSTEPERGVKGTEVQLETECGTNPIEPSSGTEPLTALTEVMQVALCNPGTVGSRRCSALCSCELQIPARAQGKGLQSFTSASNKRQMGTTTAHGHSNLSVKAGCLKLHLKIHYF